jgi:hypothetical protein
MMVGVPPTDGEHARGILVGGKETRLRLHCLHAALKSAHEFEAGRTHAQGFDRRGDGGS